MPTPHIYFDLDGTLLDSIPGIVESLRFTLNSRLGFDRTDEVLTSGIGTPLDEQIRMHYESEYQTPPSPELVLTLRETYIEHNLANHDEVIRAFDGIPELLETLQDMEIPMGIVTSKPQSTARRGLKVCGLSQYFKFVLGYDDVEHPKPHPEPIYRAMELSNAHPANCLFVGDAPHDILSGRRAGIATAGVLWGPFALEILQKAQPTHLFQAVTDISKWAAEHCES